MQAIRSRGVWLCLVTAKVRWRHNFAMVLLGACQPMESLCAEILRTTPCTAYYAELITSTHCICCAVSC
jgi:hypothetical protein